MSRVRANKITNKDASGAPLFTHGANITGVATATKFVGNVEGTLPATIGTGVTVTAAGIVSATSYYGDGSNLTGAGPTLANGSNDRVVTATGANALNGEANLTFNSSNILTATETGTGNGMGGISAATASAGGNAGYGFMTNSANRFAVTTIGSAGAESLRIYDDNNNAERLRIGDAGQFGIGGANYGTSGQVLTSGGASAAPSWATPTSSLSGQSFQAEQLTDQSMGQNAWNVVKFNAENWDTGGNYDNSDGDWYYTAPSTGKYWYKCSLKLIDLGENGRFEVALYKNSSGSWVQQKKTWRWAFNPQSNNGSVSVETTGLIALTASDKIRVYCHHNHNGGRYLDDNWCLFEMFRLGD